MTTYKEISRCRVSGSPNLIPVLSLGHQVLTGVFPKSTAQKVTTGPLDLVWCPESHLLQLKHSYEASEMYGENYGYRSGLNASMVTHLTQKVSALSRRAKLASGDVVLDIGSNDGTTLAAYPIFGLKKVGMDPTAGKFRRYYKSDVLLVEDFFSAAAFTTKSDRRAKIVTSIAMFYDLEDPVAFARQVREVLADDGIWHFEQSYLPSMLRLNSYDTICHEHIEYYSLDVVKQIIEQADLKIVDVAMNSINGGSFAVTVTPKGNRDIAPDTPVIDWLLEQEERMGLHTPAPFLQFEKRVHRHRDDLTRLIRSLRQGGRRVLGYGASTKGNVVLQFCGFTASDIEAIAEVNEDKVGCVTPGSGIPIITEVEARAMKPDYMLVLPWHFKENILQREREYLAQGGKFIFPFPEIEVV